MNQSQLQSLEVFVPSPSVARPATPSFFGVPVEQMFKRQWEITEELLAKQPELGITAHIMSGDLAAAEIITAQVKARKMTASKAVNYIGSYARFQWAVEHLPKPELYRKLPELWSGSDPDDTNPAYLELWREASRIKKGPVLDGKKLPRRRELLVYRGQRPQDPIGFSWALDRRIAYKFATGAGLRRPIDDGTIYEARVRREWVLGYLTGRGEAEVIIDMGGAGLR